MYSVLGVQQGPLGGALLDDPPAPHHRDPAGEGLDHGEVVGDEQARETQFALQLRDHLQHDPLHAHIQCAGRLVGDEQPRSEHECPREADPLPLAARQLPRCAGGELRRAAGRLRAAAATRRRRSAPPIRLACTRSGSAMHSPTLIRASSEATGSCSATPIPPCSRRRSRRRVRASTWPKTRTSPASGLTRPSTTRATVDLPEPDSPTRPRVSPGAICSVTSSSARHGVSAAAETHCDAAQVDVGLGRVGFGPRIGFRRHVVHGEARHGGQQPLRVVVAGAQQHVLDGAVLDDLAAVHDGDAVGEVGDHAHVVRDDENAHVVLGGQSPQQIQDLGLHGDVERGGGLVGDEQAGPVGDGHRDHDALPLAAGELERIAAGAGRRIGQPDMPEQFDGPGFGLGGTDVVVIADHLDDLTADAHQRVERARGLLEDHARRGTAQRSAIPGHRSR